MKKLLLLLFCVTTFPASAQSFGELFPLTNTRYPPAIGAPQLSTNGRDFFLFWGADGKTRAAKLQDGFVRGSHVVLDDISGAAVAWTGERFIAISVKPVNGQWNIVSRLLDGEARPVGPLITIAEDALSPRIAVGESSTLVLYRSHQDFRVLPLRRDGTPASAGSHVLSSSGHEPVIASNGEGFLSVIAGEEGLRAIALGQQGQPLASSILAGTRLRDIDLASDGTNYLAVWHTDTELAVATITENGDFGSPVVLDRTGVNGDLRHFGTTGVIWNGAGWTVSYVSHTQSAHASHRQSRIVQLDRTGQSILSSEEIPADTSTVTMAALDGRIFAAWYPVGLGAASVSELPLAAHTSQLPSYAAARQTLLATASSANATLIVWSERVDGGTTIHTGVRGHDGRWTERQLTSLQVSIATAVAASDGNQFVVALRGENSDLLFRLDATGRPLASPTPLPIFATAIAWNGTNYAVMGALADGVLFSPSGQLSSRVAFDETFSFTTIASDGNGFFVAGLVMDCPFILCVPIEVRGIRLGPDLKRVDTHDLVLSESFNQTVTGTAWNGSEYVLLWQDEAGGKLARIPSSPASPIEIVDTHLPFLGESMTLLADGSIVVAGRDAVLSDAKNRVAFLTSNGTVRSVFEMETRLSSDEKPSLELLSDGGVAYIASSTQSTAPHEGASRVMTAIAKPALTPPPSAPYVSARLQSGNIVIDWSTPAGTVNGYRLEYRIDDDSWNEYEQWFVPGANRKTIRKPDVGTQFAFRVRAFNDGGASPYSATALTNPSRRRAVR